jgi:hypothetical protein
MDTSADTTRGSMMVVDSSQANPRDEKLEGEWGRRERNEKGMKESRSGVRSNAKAKGGTVNTHELWSEDKDIELQVENTEDGGTNPKRQKNLRTEGMSDKTPNRTRSKSRTILSGRVRELPEC